MTLRTFAIILFFLVILLPSCGENLPVLGSFDQEVVLTDHTDKKFSFADMNGKVLLVSYIYTNCPDICHIINKKMEMLKPRLAENNLQDKVVFVSISIDPQQDTPERLRMHIKHMNFDTKNWYFVTGSIGAVYRLIAHAGIFPMRESLPQTDDKDGDYLNYVITHRDRVSIIDQEGNIRQHYKGTTMDFDIIIKDIKSLI